VVCKEVVGLKRRCKYNLGYHRGVTTRVEIFKGRDYNPTLCAHAKSRTMTLTIEYDKKISLTAIVLIVLEMARILLKP